MSAVKTGTFALLASLMTLPIALESHGHSTMALTFLTRKSLTCFCCLTTSRSPDTAMTSKPSLPASAARTSAISLKNGFVIVRTEMPIVFFSGPVRQPDAAIANVLVNKTLNIVRMVSSKRVRLQFRTRLFQFRDPRSAALPP